MPSPLAEPQVWNLVAGGYHEHLVPLFRFYSERALALAALGPDAEILDVACGPGTLAFLAAPRVARVTALDFSPDMLAELERRKRESGVTNVTAIAGDGQALPFDDASFDAAFSMFGLMFFPDRARGLLELRRVLRPRAPAVISSWLPLERVPVIHVVFRALRELMPGLPLGDASAPLSKRETITAELEAAGFRDVAVHEVAQTVTVPNVHAYWQSNLDSSAPIALLRMNLPPAKFEDLSRGILEKLEAEFGTGELAIEWPAFVSVGKTPG
jgi:ubiquinone/menaquinone biosynthesis C-methylase UbiE